jgi:hypothetical protein
MYLPPARRPQAHSEPSSTIGEGKTANPQVHRAVAVGSSFSIANVALERGTVVQRSIGSDFVTRLNTLTTLNAALANLNPAVAAITLANLGVPGVTTAMVNAAIAADNNQIYDSITQADVILWYTAALTTAVNTTVPPYTLDAHAIPKHYQGGTAKWHNKFTANMATVNPILTTAITAEIGRIRRDANGNNQTYYLIMGHIAQSQGFNVTIQADYNFAADSVGYHGYPDNNAPVLKLARTKAGAAIP